MGWAKFAKSWDEPHCRGCLHTNPPESDGSCSAYGYNGVDCQAQPCVCRNHVVVVHVNPAAGNHGHVDYVFDNIPCCKVCGVVRPAEGWTRRCKGPTELSLRTTKPQSTTEPSTDDRDRLVKTFAYEWVCFNHDVGDRYPYLVTDVTDDCMLELEGMSGLFASTCFHRVPAPPTPSADGRYCTHHDDDPAHGKECYVTAAPVEQSEEGESKQ